MTPLYRAPRNLAHNDRRVNSRVIPCPECGAVVRAFCTTLDGRTRRTPHPARRRMAIRAERLEASA